MSKSIDNFRTCSFAPLQYGMHDPVTGLYIYYRDRHGVASCVVAKSETAALLPWRKMDEVVAYTVYRTTEMYDEYDRATAERTIQRHLNHYGIDLNTCKALR